VVPPSARADFESALGRRAAREPLAYITGEKGFRRIVLRVDRSVLIPRPETELLVDVVKDAAPARVLEVATGSGAVALALADELPSVSIMATDVSPEALEVAAGNARRLGLGDRARFLRADLLDGVEGRYDAIAANLPYVRAGEIDTLQPEIAFEPRGALDGGPDGLDLVRALVAQIAAGFAYGEVSRRILAPGGLVALEIGDDQGPATARILTDAGFEHVVIHQDLTGRDRVAAARAPQ
jgi:release factor glutamine methyltransferase